MCVTEDSQAMAEHVQAHSCVICSQSPKMWRRGRRLSRHASQYRASTWLFNSVDAACASVFSSLMILILVILRDKKQTRIQLTEEQDDRLRNYNEQMGEWHNGVRKRKHCDGWIFLTHVGQKGLVVMISCWGSNLDSSSSCVQVFVSIVLTSFHVSIPWVLVSALCQSYCSPAQCATGGQK